MAKKVRKSSSTCTCGPSNFIWLIVAAIVMAVGLYVLVMAVQSQWNAAAPFVNVALWYALAFIIFAFGKMAKWKSCAGCVAHGKY